MSDLRPHNSSSNSKRGDSRKANNASNSASAPPSPTFTPNEGDTNQAPTQTPISSPVSTSNGSNKNTTGVVNRSNSSNISNAGNSSHNDGILLTPSLTATGASTRRIYAFPGGNVGSNKPKQSRSGTTSNSSSGSRPDPSSSSGSRPDPSSSSGGGGSSCGRPITATESTDMPSVPSMKYTDAAKRASIDSGQAPQSAPSCADFFEKVLKATKDHLPSPKSPEKCPLFCCFYAEFDNQVGPKICFQSPRRFMDRDIHISTDQIHDMLETTFRQVAADSETNEKGSEVRSGKQPLSSKSSPDAEDVEDVKLPPGTLSIFDSTSEYIITGSELTGKIINISTHSMHILTRPTVIVDERYERNSLLFSVGLILRRAADPRPFRPLLSKWALTLRSMEIESHFLTDPRLRRQVQPLLERVLVSLNSPQWECNLLLSPSNSLNLKLFHPPKPEASPVPDYAVPVLLRRDLQLQMFDWDLAINWVILHIDGVTNARRIALKAEVDLEMVLACLRVLKHHGVIALVDNFMYTNRYEFTDRATAMLAGKEPKLLQEAVDYAVKTSKVSGSGGAGNRVGFHQGPGSVGSNVSPGSIESDPQESSSLSQRNLPASFTPPNAGSFGRSPTIRLAMMAAQSLERDAPSILHRRERYHHLKPAIAQLYCACNRNLSFGDLWVAKTTDLTDHLSVPTLYRLGDASHEPPLQFRRMSQEFTVRSPSESNPGEAPRRHGVNWNEVFQSFDHRRFASFGLVHGLLRRVHGFPYFPYPFPEYVGPKDESDGHSLGSSYLRGSQFSGNRELSEEKSYHLACGVASKMDGTHCDDELVCFFGYPFAKLVLLVEKHGKEKVVLMYSTVSR